MSSFSIKTNCPIEIGDEVLVDDGWYTVSDILFLASIGERDLVVFLELAGREELEVVTNGLVVRRRGKPM